MDLDTFAKEAKVAGAVVFMAVQGGLGQSGALQAFFEFHKVPFTGAAHACCQTLECCPHYCPDKLCGRFSANFMGFQYGHAHACWGKLLQGMSDVAGC